MNKTVTFITCTAIVCLMIFFNIIAFIIPQHVNIIGTICYCALADVMFTFCAWAIWDSRAE